MTKLFSIFISRRILKKFFFRTYLLSNLYKYLDRFFLFRVNLISIKYFQINQIRLVNNNRIDFKDIYSNT